MHITNQFIQLGFIGPLLSGEKDLGLFAMINGALKLGDAFGAPVLLSRLRNRAAFPTGESILNV